jgi:thymidylate kinase
VIVLVEGIDRVGKTTLCNYLQNRGFKLMKFPRNSNRKKEEERIKIKAIMDTLENFSDEDIVLDRLYLSEYVYGFADRGYIHDVSDFLEQAQKMGIVHVIVNPTDLDKSSEEHGTDLELHALMFKRCVSTLNRFNCHVVECDYKNMMEKVEEII